MIGPIMFTSYNKEGKLCALNHSSLIILLRCSDNSAISLSTSRGG
jgi:hypothetical protein